MIETALVAYLKADAGVAALTTRIRPFPLPETEPMPAISYARISTGRRHKYLGRSNVQLPVIQLTCWGSTPDEAMAVVEAVDAALDSRSIPGAQVCLVQDLRPAMFEPSPRPLWRGDLDVLIGQIE